MEKRVVGAGATILSVLLPWRVTGCYRWNGNSWRSPRTSNLRVEFASVFHVASLPPQNVQCSRSEIRTRNLHFQISSQVRPTLETHGRPTALKQLLLYSPEPLAVCESHTCTACQRDWHRGKSVASWGGWSLPWDHIYRAAVESPAGIAALHKAHRPEQ